MSDFQVLKQLSQESYAEGYAAGLERAAKVCEEKAEYWRVGSGTGVSQYARERCGHYEDAAETLAADIRSEPAA